MAIRTPTIVPRNRAGPSAAVLLQHTFEVLAEEILDLEDHLGAVNQGNGQPAPPELRSRMYEQARDQTNEQTGTPIAQRPRDVLGLVWTTNHQRGDTWSQPSSALPS